MTLELQKFLIAEALNLQKIESASKNQTYLEILGVGHKELQHSNFLKWLLSPLGSHQIGDFFLRGFLNLLQKIPSDRKIQINLADLSETQVIREKENIDLLIINQHLKFTICIENKIGAGLNEHQLPKYYEIVENKNVEFNHLNIYVYLTPFVRHLPEDYEDIYQNLTYSAISKLISDTIKNNNIPNEYLIMIKDYMTNLNKNILRQATDIELAQAIYQKHKRAIDYIWQYRPNFDSIAKEISDYFSLQSNYINLTPNDPIVRILPKEVAEKFMYPFNSWKDTNAMFAIELFCEGEKIWIKFCFGGIWVDENEKKSSQKIKDRYFQEMKNFKSLSNYRVLRSKSSTDYPSVANIELIKIGDNIIFESSSIFEAFVKRFKEFEEKTLANWIKEVNEKIVKIDSLDN